MSELLRGTPLAKAIRQKLKERISGHVETPGLAAILVGDDPASHLYVSLKERAAKQAGMYFERIEFPADITQGKLIKAVKKLNERDDIHGILVQLPLPNQNEDAVIAAINPKKDVDGFHKESLKALEKGDRSLIPPVALAVMRLVQASQQPLQNKTAVVLSNHEIFASPIIELMKEAGVSASYLNPNSSSLASKTRAADIIVIALGRAGFLTPHMVEPGAIVIDVGT
ncbi:MAG: bifunctional 5,10-methylenetetrahydrofolate dehydrogenase/5,10-methenyltetrahydrofolate cyclohydrolase, partial [bacterium]|nr:bifunctional 5,10-methylenetetrahydrofolate dehydrogenase/5,10-methenyltetrahydrofolate cyclohydrolase [bacterium]